MRAAASRGFRRRLRRRGGRPAVAAQAVHGRAARRGELRVWPLRDAPLLPAAPLAVSWWPSSANPCGVTEAIAQDLFRLSRAACWLAITSPTPFEFVRVVEVQNAKCASRSWTIAGRIGAFRPDIAFDLLHGLVGIGLAGGELRGGVSILESAGRSRCTEQRRAMSRRADGGSSIETGGRSPPDFNRLAQDTDIRFVRAFPPIRFFCRRSFRVQRWARVRVADLRRAAPSGPLRLAFLDGRRPRRIGVHCGHDVDPPLD